MTKLGIILLSIWLLLFGVSFAQDESNASDEALQATEQLAEELSSRSEFENLSSSQQDQLASQVITQDEFNNLLASWDRTANQAELMLQQTQVDNLQLQNMRKALDINRQQANKYVIGNQPHLSDLQNQFEALNPQSTDEDVSTEIPSSETGAGDQDSPTADNVAKVSATGELKERRQEVQSKLAQLESNIFAANQIVREANSYINQIDARLRINYYTALLTRTGFPLSPDNVRLGLYGIYEIVSGTFGEVKQNLSKGLTDGTASSKWPTSLIFLLLSLGGFIWLRRMAWMVLNHEGEWKSSLRRIFMPLVPTGVSIIAQPAIINIVANSIEFANVLGPDGALLLDCIKIWAYFLCAANWLRWAIIQLNQESRAGRSSFGLELYVIAVLAGIDFTLSELTSIAGLPPQAASTLHFLIVIGATYAIWSITVPKKFATLFGHVKVDSVPRLRELFRLGVRIGAVTAVALSLLGYFSASFQLFRGITTTAFLVFAVIHGQRLIQSLLIHIFVEVGWMDDEQVQKVDEKLWPVLIRIALWVVVIPTIALSWGVPSSILQEIWHRVRAGLSIGESTLSFGNIIQALIFLYIGFWLVRVLKNVLDKSVLVRTKLDIGARSAIVALSGYVAYSVIVIIALNIAGLDMSSLTLIAGALSVGIGFGMQNIVQNFISGIILLIERPIKKGDWIKVGSNEGYVHNIAVRSTQIRTFDDSTIIVPNADLITQPVENWFINDESARVRALVQVDYNADPELVEEILLDTIKDSTYKRFDPDSSVVIRSFEDSGINFELRYWIRNADYITRARSETFFSVLKRFKEAGINIPFPQREIRLLKDDENSLVESNEQINTPKDK